MRQKMGLIPQLIPFFLFLHHMYLFDQCQSILYIFLHYGVRHPGLLLWIS